MNSTDRFALQARILHWVMAIMILAMLFIGAGMVSTASRAYPDLLAWHRPIGIAVLALALVRLGVRMTHRPPSLPADLPVLQRAMASAMHLALYTLMLAMPLIGWAMLSAAGTPVVLWPGTALPPILSHNVRVFGWLRWIHGIAGYGFFLLILGHMTAALLHGLIRRDGVFESMARFGATAQPRDEASSASEAES